MKIKILNEKLEEYSTKEIIFNKDFYIPIIIGGEEYSDNDRECEIYYGIIYDNKHIGNVAIDNNTIEGFEIYPQFENQGLGRKTIKSLLKKHPEINFVESTPNAKQFWEKCGFKINYYNEDSGLYNMYLSEKLIEKIVKIGNKWQVQSEKGRNMGTYDTKAEAEKRLQQVHYFKYANEDLDNNIIIINRNNINNYIKEYFDKYSDDELIKLSPAKVINDFEGGTGAFLVTEQGQILKLDRIHADFCLQLFENVFENENITISYDMPEREVGYYTLNYFLNDRNWCALNNNYYWLNTSSYINLPEKINYQQKVVIEEFIYYCSMHKKSIDINLKGLSRGTFEFVDYSPKDIMRLIQQLYYRDNKIEENLDIFDSITKQELNKINNWLDKYGFEIELITDSDVIDWSNDDCKDSVGMFLGDIQDNASVFPVALNRKAIEEYCKENSSDDSSYNNELIYGIRGTLWHEAGHGIYDYLSEFYEMPEDVEKCVEEFARNVEHSELFEILQDYMSDF